MLQHVFTSILLRGLESRPTAQSIFSFHDDTSTKPTVQGAMRAEKAQLKSGHLFF